jgi:hypothetical protein
MESAEKHLQKGSEFWKAVLFADDNKFSVFVSYERNFVGEYPGKLYGQKSSSSGPTCWW